MTAVGLVTLLGLAGLLLFMARHPAATTVKRAWAWMFLLFCVVTASHNAGATPGVHFFIYGLPAIAAAIWAIAVLPTCLSAGVFSALFIFNVAGNYVGLDQLKIWTVDVLDLAVWAQIALLFNLARLNPESVELSVHRQQRPSNNTLKVIDGLGNRKGAQP